MNPYTTDYAHKSYIDKLKHWGRGYVSPEKRRATRRGKREANGSIKVSHPATHNGDCWRIEWSSGRQSTVNPRKTLYRSITVWGTLEEARQLLDIIVSVPHRSLEQADDAIGPYIEWKPQNIGGTNVGGRYRRVIKGPLPAPVLTPQAIKRYFIERDYWRVRLLDTLEEYRRLGDD